MSISTAEQLAQVSKKIINGMEFVYIGTETYREYQIPVESQLFTVRVETPEWLYVRPSGTHLIIDRDGVAHYIPKFVHLKWKNLEGEQANF